MKEKRVWKSAKSQQFICMVASLLGMEVFENDLSFIVIVMSFGGHFGDWVLSLLSCLGYR